MVLDDQKKLMEYISNKYSLVLNKEKIEKEFDLVLTCPGFEERTIGLLQHLTKKTKIKKFISILYRPAEESLYLKNLQSLDRFKKSIRDLNIESDDVIFVDPLNPWEFKKILNNIINQNQINKKSKVLVDITSFTRIFLYEIIYALYNSNSAFTFAYTQPEDYVDVLPVGINKVMVSPSYPGNPRPNKKSFLLLFLGWESDRTRGVFEEYNSDEHVCVIGKSAIDQKHHEWAQTSYDRNKELINQIGNPEYCSTLDFDNILKFISKIYKKKTSEYDKKNESFYFVMSGLGPKIQNLAAAIFALCKKDIQLIYGSPSYWISPTILPTEKAIESKGIGRTFIYGPFTKNLIDEL